MTTGVTQQIRQHNDFDVVIVGAGIAGGVLANLLAIRNLRVLLVDRATFPRQKVCGGCINGRAAAVLNQIGITAERLNAVPLTELRIASGFRTSTLPHRDGYAVSRLTLDQALIDAAKARGITFRDRCEARLGAVSPSDRIVELITGTEREVVRTSVVIAASGLAGSLLRKSESLPSTVRPGSRIGVGALVEDSPSDDYASGTIHMAVGSSGYVGITRVESDRLNIAAAIAPHSLRSGTPIGEVIGSILRQPTWPVGDAILQADWKGTPELTRERLAVGDERLFLLGDAIGYIEPFTGEGMAWASTGACELAPLVEQGVRNWSPDLVSAWAARHRTLVKKRQRVCRMVAGLLRRPKLSRLTIAALSRWPSLAAPLLKHVNQAESNGTVIRS